MKYTHLLYVRKFSIFTNSSELFVYGVSTSDIYHTIGEFYCRSLTQVQRIDYVELTDDNIQAHLDFWEQDGKKICPFFDRYPK